MNETTVSVTDFSSGNCLGQYVIEEPLGVGAHGTVYRAHSSDAINEPVALKIVETTSRLESMLLEPSLLSRLSHPNIVSLQDYFLHLGKLVLVMEYIDGVDLDRYTVQHGSLEPAEVREFLVQISSALGVAHGNHIIHRDIKPSNIMVSNSDLPKRFVLTDFGISRITEGIQFERHVGGTYQFMAPEQIRGRPLAESDFWSLGVTAYWLLTGKLPFQGETTDQIRKSIFFDTPLSLSQFICDVPDDINCVVQRMLEKDPIRRLHDSDELLDLLKRDTRLSVSIPQQDEVSKGRLEPLPSNTWREITQTRIRRAWILFWITITISTIPNGIIGPALIIAGSLLFFFAHSRKTSSLKVVGAMGLILLGSLVVYVTFTFLLSGMSEQGILMIIYIIDPLISVVFALIAIHQLVKARKLTRETLLIDALTSGSKSRDERLNIAREYLDSHIGDLDAHTMYVEELLALGRPKEAIIEAKIILIMDPYNFGASLLLAYAYFEAGLLKECEQVCNGYLAVSGQCFEFSDLAQRCRLTEREAT